MPTGMDALYEETHGFPNRQEQLDLSSPIMMPSSSMFTLPCKVGKLVLRVRTAHGARAEGDSEGGRARRACIVLAAVYVLRGASASAGSSSTTITYCSPTLKPEKVPLTLGSPSSARQAHSTRDERGRADERSCACWCARAHHQLSSVVRRRLEGTRCLWREQRVSV